MSEKEQVQLVKDWFKKYGTSLILGAIIALVGTYSWRFWQQHEIQRSEQASFLYEQLLSFQANHQAQQFTQVTNELMSKYPRTPYAALAGLAAANDAVAQGNLELAEQKLQWVVIYGNNKEIQQIAKIRAARVLLAQNKPQAALNLLSTISNKNYYSAVELVKGDIYVAMNNKEAAKTAYQNALNTLPASAAVKSLIEMKLTELM
jgi:predicted negative regulator of RcsB-dependent stress response